MLLIEDGAHYAREFLIDGLLLRSGARVAVRIAWGCNLTLKGEATVKLSRSGAEPGLPAAPR